MEPVNVAASVFKAHCSRLLNEVASQGRTFVITKNGKPIARIEPVEPQESLEGSWKGLVEIKGDIVNFDKTKDWEILSERDELNTSLTPITSDRKPMMGRWQGQGKIKGDLVDFVTRREW